MRAGAMRHKITIQQWSADSPPVNAAGEPSGSWTTYKTVWAEATTSISREILEIGIQGVARATFRMWYDSGVTHDMRIVHDSITYEIEGINTIRNKEGLEIISQALID